MASVPIRNREPNTYLRACECVFENNFLGWRIVRIVVPYAIPITQTLIGDKRAYPKSLSAILMPDRDAVGLLEVTDFLKA
jgi:hypothetical protein